MNRTLALPSPPTLQCRLSPGFTGTRGDCEPDKITSPAFKGMPSRPSVLASHTTAFTGLPCTAAPVEVLTTSPFFSSTMPASDRSSSRGWRRVPPSTSCPGS